MQAIFNAPVLAVQGQQAPGVGFLCPQAGEAMNGFGAELARGEFRGLALEAVDLRGVGRIQIAFQFAADPEAADL
jgi:hypothetical protein